MRDEPHDKWLIEWRREGERLRARIATLEAERDQARQTVAAEVIESLMPVSRITNRIPSRYLLVLEEYITEQFSPTEGHIKEVFEVERTRRQDRQQILDDCRKAEARAATLEAERGRLAELLAWAVPIIQSEEVVLSDEWAADARKAIAATQERASDGE